MKAHEFVRLCRIVKGRQDRRSISFPVDHVDDGLELGVITVIVCKYGLCCDVLVSLGYTLLRMENLLSSIEPGRRT